MARKKLYGAAAAAHARKKARTSIAVRGPRSVTKYRTRTRTIRVRGRRRRSSGIGGGAAFRPLKSQLWDLASSAFYGYATTSVGTERSKSAREYMAMLPTFESIGAPASHGLLFHLGASFTGGTLRRILGHMSHAALMRASYNFGQQEFDWDKSTKLAGDDDGITLSGEIGDDEIGDDDVD